MNKIRDEEWRASTSSSLKIAKKFDVYTKEIQIFLNKMIDAAVSWAKSCMKAKSFWNSKCDSETKTTRRLRRVWSTSRNLNDWKAYLKFNDKKQKTIVKTKRLHFSLQMQLAISSQSSIWKFAKWVRLKSDYSREVSKMSSLNTNNQTINTFDEKIEILKNVFFLSSLFADLSDIINYNYSISKKYLMIIIEIEIKQTISRFKIDKTSNSNELSNRILKTCFEILIIMLTFLF